MEPDEKPTLEIPKVDPNLAMLTEIREGVRSLANGMNELHLWKDEANARLDAFERWRQRTSDRVRGLDASTSENDLAHEAQLAQERAAREALAKQVSDLINIANRIEGAFSKVSENKWVQRILIGVALLIMSWLASKGVVVK